MANRRIDPVGYTPFQAQPVLADGLLSVQRDDGALERKVAQGMANLADQYGRQAEQEATAAGAKQGQLDAYNGGPGASAVTGGEDAGTTASVNGQAGHIAGAQGGYRVLPGSGVDQAKEVLRHEEGFRETPYWDTTAYRIGYGSDTVTQADGTVAKVRPGMTITKDDAERDLQRRVTQGEGAKVREDVGPDVFDKLPPGTQGGLISVGYNYGSLPPAVVAAAKTGDISAVASAVRALPANSERRGREADLITGSVAPAPAADTGYVDPQVVTGTASPAPEGTPSDQAAASAPGYAKLPSAASVAPISVTPVRTAIKIEPGKAGSFRPTGSDTFYGRAYDVRGTKTYLQELDLTMLQDQSAVYEKYKDDPVMLRQSLGELKQAHLKEHVFPEIAPEYSAAFDKQAFQLQSRAQDLADERKRASDKVDFLDRVQSLEDQKSQQLAGLKANDATGATSLSTLQAGIDEHYNTAVARGILSPEEAERYKRSSRSDTVTGFYTKQAANMPADDIKTLRAGMTADYAAGKLAGVNAGDWDRIDKGLTAAESARRTQDAKADADLATRGKDIAERVARGLPVDAQTMARFQLDASTAPKGKEVVASTLVRLKLAEAIRTQPIGEVQKALPGILGQGATPDDYDFAQKAIADHRKELETDPLGVAERFGVLPASPGLPIDGDVDPRAVAQSFAERINAAKAAAGHFGVQPKFFRPGEADQIDQAVKADPQRGLAIAAGLVAAGGPDAEKILTELGADAPAVSQSGAIIAEGGDPKAALDLISGYGKTPDGNNYPDMPNTKRIPLAQKETGGALVFTPEEQTRLDASAGAIARKRIYDAGLKPTDPAAEPIYQRAYNEAAGASYVNDVQYGGFGNYDPGFWWKSRKVAIPSSIRADKFQDVVQSLTDDDVGAVAAKNGRTWKAADFKKALPVAVKGGYAFALGDPSGSAPQFIADDKGNPVVLDIGGMKDKLAARNVGAFR